MPPRLRLQLLGEFRIHREGRELSAFTAPRRQELLAHLVLHAGSPQPRQYLSFLLWPDSTEPQARTNLRQLLHRLRRELSDAGRFIAFEGPTITWRSDAPADVDVLLLEDALQRAADARNKDDPAAETEALQRVRDLYGGDLVPACYARWIASERERLRRRVIESLGRLIQLEEERERSASALRVALRLHELDPLSEHCCRTLMRLHALAGDPAKSLEVFRRFRERLKAELEVEPGAETLRLEARLRTRSPPPVKGDRKNASPVIPPLVGRYSEWNELQNVWEGTRGARPRLALLSGEPGIGKTRLAGEFLAWAAREGLATAEARCHAGEGTLPYSPVSEWLRTPPFLDSARRIEGIWRAELGLILPELITEPPEAPPPDGRTVLLRRPRLFQALARAFREIGQPAILLLDDIQWCDGETLEWLHYLFRYQGDAPLLLVAALRLGELPLDDRLPRWLELFRGEDRLVEIPLAPLAREPTRALAEAVEQRELAEDEASALHRETEGNPLFVVEALRAGAGARADYTQESHWVVAALPERIKGVIRARLAQLSSSGLRILELASAVGREFSPQLLEAADRLDQDSLILALDELLERHLIRERGPVSLEFSHDRIREVTYGGLTSARRGLLHRRVAEALEWIHGREDEAVSGAMAYHFERAGLPSKAIPHYRRAAERAMRMYAYEESAAHLEKALELLHREPEDPERMARELELQIARGVPLVALHHYGGPRVREAYSRAGALARELGQEPDPPVLRGLALANLMSSRIDEVLDLAGQLGSAAEREDDPVLGAEAHYVLGVAQYWMGRLSESRRHLELGLAMYDTSRRSRHLALYAQDPSIICRIRLALTLWHMGRPKRAHRLCLEALDDAEDLDHPFTLAYSRYFGSWTLAECRDLAATRHHVQALVHDASEHGLALWPTMAALLEGWLRVEMDGDAAGIEQMVESAQEYREEGVSLGFPYQQGLLARACRKVGRREEALVAVEEALDMAAATSQCFWDAELHRVRGELLAELGGRNADAEASLRAAATAADRQGAVTLAARAAKSLERWVGRSEQEEHHVSPSSTRR